jgi:Cys-tRNA(Pro) deacylase
MSDDSVDRLRNALAALGFQAELLISDDGATHTAEQAAASARCALGQIVKTLVILVRDRPMLVLVPGDRRLDDRLVAARFAVGRKQVRLASAGEVLELTGYAVGGVTPFGTTSQLAVLVDESFQRFETIWLSGGTPNAIFPMPLATVVKLTGGEFAAVAT